MSQGLSASRLINVTVNLAPTGAQFANVDSLVIIGDSTVIDVTERIRSYNSLADVAADFGTSAPEYLGAELFFSQLPQPTQLYIARWAHAATAGQLNGGFLSASEQLLSNFTAITAGKLNIVIDGTSLTLTTIDLSAQTNLNGVAAIVTTALTTHGVCTWDSVRSRFIIKSATTGASSTVAFATTVSGSDIGPILGINAAGGGNSVAGIVAESAVSCVTLLDDMSTYFYGITFASPDIVNADHIAIAAYVQGASNAHIYGASSVEAGALNSETSTDIGAELMAANYTRSFASWSSSNAYTACSIFGREFTVNFQANNSVIAIMYKQEPGVIAENLTSSQADTLDSKRYNYFAAFNNGTAIIVNGWMSGPAYIDEIHGTDALANEVQTNLYNLLFDADTKIPQTDPGIHQLVTEAEATCAAFVANGLLAPGTWTVGGFGTLNQGDFLSKGYYVYAPPVASQAGADRAARKSPPIQIAAKLAGAVNTVDVIINVNR